MGAAFHVVMPALLDKLSPVSVAPKSARPLGMTVSAHAWHWKSLTDPVDAKDVTTRSAYVADPIATFLIATERSAVVAVIAAGNPGGNVIVLVVVSVPMMTLSSLVSTWMY